MKGDLEIITSIKENIQLNEAIRFLYEQYAESVYAYIIKMGASRQDSEDVFQEAIVGFIALVKDNKFRGDSSIKTFLTAMARNLWMNEWKKRDRAGARETLFEKTRDPEDTDLMTAIQEREAQTQLLSVLSSLGDACKKLLTLYYYEDIPMKELAEQLSYTNEQVVRNKKYKCMKELTEMLRNNPVLANQIRDKVYKQ